MRLHDLRAIMENEISKGGGGLVCGAGILTFWVEFWAMDGIQSSPVSIAARMYINREQRRIRSRGRVQLGIDEGPQQAPGTVRIFWERWEAMYEQILPADGWSFVPRNEVSGNPLCS